MKNTYKITLFLLLVIAVWVIGLGDRPYQFEQRSTSTADRDIRWVSASQEPETEVLALGSTMPEFQLTDFRGREWTSNEFEGMEATVVVFMGTECPLVRLYASRLNEIVERFSESKVQMIGINSNVQDSMAELKAFARDTKIEFPLLKDPGNRVADLFRAQRTPEAFVFNSERQLVYRGRIDDQYTYGRQRPEVVQEYIVEAVNGVLKGTDIATSETEPVGCIIGRAKKVVAGQDATVTYTQHISRILQDKCVGCHRPGEIGPFSLLEYDEVAGWADMIQEVVNENRMPPWHADPSHGQFKNDIRLSENEKDLINRWVKEGVAQGDPKFLPEPRTFTDGWQIGEPDVVIPMAKKAFQVPATGVVEYQYFVVPTNFKKDRWVTAAEIRIGNRQVVHHVIVGLNREGRRAHGGVDSEWIAACAPGSPPLQLPEGYAKLIPAGSKLVFQMHYTPNGTAQEDISSIGFKFVEKEDVQKAVGTQEVINQRFRIPPGAENHEVVARKLIRQDSIMLAMFPHMHLRGKSFRYEAKYPDGSKEILLDVPEYDFNWQNSYIFEEPKQLPEGTLLVCTAHFDNSKRNIANPDPKKTVRWGDQTFEEMMIGYFDIALADQDLTKER
jgi:peroxiredoxin